MIAVLTISTITILAMVISVLFKPNVTIKNLTLGLYWIIALVGAITILIFKLLQFDELVGNLTKNSAVNPLKILTLFISITILSIFLDEVGFFNYLANLTLQKAKASQKLLFVYLFLTVSILTIFTSNDIIILTFTPFICYFSKNAKINPIPYLICEFVSANTWSMFFIIGNPTNIYLASSCNVTFLQYFKVMFLPTILGGLTSFVLLFLIFRKTLSKPFEPTAQNVKIKDKTLLIIGLIHLVSCTVLLAISSYINLEMWIITLFFAISLFVCALLVKAIKKERPTELKSCIRRAPWQLVPFVLSMFVIVLSLNYHGVTAKLSVFLSGGTSTIIKYGTSSAVFANLINNIPMSVLFSSVLANLSPNFLSMGIFATIIGSNIGAFISPIGALAGIMWSDILKKQGVKLPFHKLFIFNTMIALPVLFASLFGLYIVL